ncbi:hypothetical protein OGAPHI_004797 [Ogataea philodendri]|uniref:ER membrane protein complex subunit 7 beta-sandwich domain-containing protein n=1 Tax=Ogataea philodendri TaxID=1378263 RepID=A0A9P8T2R0_9ASCO|nr:uncharacterized protein OGAPHI_004797 [Ogataea philodendri]KAH3664083.1 hypothetical protein OGAPHI_004797 [Ogataea philodendri]
MTTLNILIYALCLFSAQITAQRIIGKFELPQAGLADPARAFVRVSNATWTGHYHLNRHGEFSLTGLSVGEYDLALNSLDFALASTNFYTLAVHDDGYDVYQNVPGILASNTPVPLASKLNFSAENVRVKRFADPDQTSGILEMIPFWGVLKQYPMLGVVMGVMVVIALMPTIVGFIDPEFSERVLQAQQQVADNRKPAPPKQ